MDPRRERDGRDLAAGHVESPELPSLRDHDGHPVRCPRVPGEHADRLHPLAHVLRDRVHDDPLRPGVQIAQPERRAGPELVALPLDGRVGKATREGDPAAIGRDFAGETATTRKAVLPRRHPARHLRDLSGLQLHAAHVQCALQGVPHQFALDVIHRPRHGLPRSAHMVEEVPAVFRHRWPRRRATVAGHDLDSRAPVPMVHPDAPALGNQDVPRRRQSTRASSRACPGWIAPGADSTRPRPSPRGCSGRHGRTRTRSCCRPESSWGGS